MSLNKLIAVLILGSSSLAVADTATATTTATTAPATEPAKQPQRMWTNHAAEMYATKGGANKPVVTDPGVWVTAGRDPHNKR